MSAGGYYNARVREAGHAMTEPDFDELDGLAGEDNAAHAAGKICVRCDQQIEADQPVRRRISGDWVHETCPARIP
jgi:hypothetical protein